MFVSDILTQHSISPTTLYLIRTKCSTFISESNDQPIFKRLDWTYGTSSKVKVRHSPTFASNQILDEAFNGSIENTIVPVTTQPLDNVTESDEWYYVFPTNGYKFLYSQLIVDYRYHVACLEGRNLDRSDIVDIVRESYVHNDNLAEGIKESVEMLLYGMPSFYVVSCAKYRHYPSLLTTIRQN